MREICPTYSVSSALALALLSSNALASSLLGQRDDSSPQYGQRGGPSFEVAGAGFKCEYPSMEGYTACNTPSDRSCWLKASHNNTADFTVDTDCMYNGTHVEGFANVAADEAVWPEGIQREYWLEADLQAIAPDGYLKELGQLLNGTYPGPHIEGCWGDELVIHVTNKIPNLGATVHWHGVRQLNSNQMDGVNGVTQCPIATGESFTYRFRLTQYGHTWYHSHYQTQYSDGLHGALTIYGPSSASWDEAVEPILMTDWLHDNSSVSFRQEVSGGVTVMDSILVGGTGVYHCPDDDPKCCSLCLGGGCAPGGDPEYCCTADPRCFDRDTQARQSGGPYSLNVTDGKRYLLKLVTTSAEAHFIFSIDHHDLQVVAADFVPIKPYMTDSVFVGIGQRYDIVFTAKPKQQSIDGDYWLRTRVADTCGTIVQKDERTGIIRYNHSSTASPTTFTDLQRTACVDEPVSSLQPIVPWNVSGIQGNISDFTFESGALLHAVHGAYRWAMTNTPMWLDYGNPTLLNIQNDTYLHTAENAIVDYPFPGGYAYLVVDGSSFTPGKGNVSSAHPMHLHGHDFAILAQEDNWPGRDIPPLQHLNPARRDTVTLASFGYVALAFRLDNPGTWLLHCHIAWHSSSGFALQILENRDRILPTLSSLENVKQSCQGWDKMALSFKQEESGV